MQAARKGRFTGSTAVSLAFALCALPVSAAHGQQPSPVAAPAVPAAAPAREMPRPDDLEPGVNTSTTATSAPATPATSAAAPSSRAPTPKAVAADPPPGAKPTPAARGAAAADATGAKESGRKGTDRLQLDATEITGNRELPKVLYIVPWKRSDLGDVAGKPVNSLVDEVLQPLDRDVFQRENRYYDALSPAASAPKTGTVPGSGNPP